MRGKHSRAAANRRAKADAAAASAAAERSDELGARLAVAVSEQASANEAADVLQERIRAQESATAARVSELMAEAAALEAGAAADEERSRTLRREFDRVLFSSFLSRDRTGHIAFDFVTLPKGEAFITETAVRMLQQYLGGGPGGGVKSATTWRGGWAYRSSRIRTIGTQRSTKIPHERPSLTDVGNMSDPRRSLRGRLFAGAVSARPAGRHPTPRWRPAPSGTPHTEMALLGRDDSPYR
jgi:hypothetical protein